MERQNRPQPSQHNASEHSAKASNDDRVILTSGSYNMNFIDWDNECEAVLDHMQSCVGII